MNKCNKMYIYMVLCIALLAFSLAGCRKQGDPAESSSQEQVQEELSEYVYVPEYLDTAGEAPLGPTVYHDGCLYWQEYNTEGIRLGVKLFRRPLNGQTFEEIPIALKENWLIQEYIPAADGCLYCLILEETMPETWEGANYYFIKYDYEGNELYCIPLSEYMETGSGFLTAVDGEGHAYIYTAAERKLVLFDESGGYYGSVEPESYFSDLLCDGEGRVCCVWTESKGSVTTRAMAVLDYEKKALGEVYGNIPLGWIFCGSEEGADFLLIKASNVLYRYDLSSQQYEELLTWQESDLSGINVEQVIELSDGRLLAVVGTRSLTETDERDIVFLTRTRRDQVVPKTELLVAVMYVDWEFRDKVAEFNKQNDAYKLVLRDYSDNGDPLDAIDAGRENLRMDISTGNAPDIYYFYRGSSPLYPIEPYAEAGVFEDLGLYLDRSENYDREDFVDAVLEGGTYADTLVYISTTFQIGTVIGRTSQVGSEAGWTMEEFGAFMEAYPGVSPIYYMDRYDLLTRLMGFNQEFFIDWDSGECYFDSDEFVKFLECTNKFRSWDFGYDGNFMDAVREDKVLLDTVGYSRMDQIDEIRQTFGGDEVTFIGYPTFDGTPCHEYMGVGGCAISSASEHKDVAWEFIEFLLDHAEVDYNGWGLMSEKEKLSRQIKEAVSQPYEVDENGEIMLDEQGEPIRRIITDPDAGSAWWYAPLPEDEELIWELISSARRTAESNTQVMAIIEEEVGAYYTGQKSAEEVAEVIQGRVQNYVSESQ